MFDYITERIGYWGRIWAQQLDKHNFSKGSFKPKQYTKVNGVQESAAPRVLNSN